MYFNVLLCVKTLRLNAGDNFCWEMPYFLCVCPHMYVMHTLFWRAVLCWFEESSVLPSHTTCSSSGTRTWYSLMRSDSPGHSEAKWAFRRMGLWRDPQHSKEGKQLDDFQMACSGKKLKGEGYMELVLVWSSASTGTLLVKEGLSERCHMSWKHQAPDVPV